MRDLFGHETQDLWTTEAAVQFYDQVKKWIGGFAATLYGLITLTFAGVIGEKAPTVHARICDRLDFLDIELNQKHNAKNAPLISPEANYDKIRGIRTNKDLMIAKSATHSRNLVSPRKLRP